MYKQATSPDVGISEMKYDATTGNTSKITHNIISAYRTNKEYVMMYFVIVVLYIFIEHKFNVIMILFLLINKKKRKEKKTVFPVITP